MYRTGPAAPRRAWLWDRPERLATLAFALGTAAASASFGVLVVWRDDSLLLAILAACLFGGALWGALVGAAVSLPRWITALVLAAACVAADFPKLLAVGLGATDLRPSMEPRAGQNIALLSDAALLVSFAPVLRLARGLHRGDVRRTPLDLTLSASAWLVAVAAAGMVVARGLGPRLICATVLLAGLLALARAIAQARAAADERGAALRRMAGGGLRGATLAVLGGVAAVAMRLPEVNVSPVIAKIYQQRSDLAPCHIRPASGGRPGLSLWSVSCQSGLVGWDESAGRAIEGEDLEKRLRAP